MNVDVGLGSGISKFADDTKIENSVLTDIVDRQWLQKDLHKNSAWSNSLEMPFNVDKCQVLRLGTKNKKLNYEMRGVKLESVQWLRRN